MNRQSVEDIKASGDRSELALLSAIVNSSDDAIVGKTPAGVITSFNPAAERIYGYSAEEIIGQPITSLCPPGRLGEISEILAALGRGERVVHCETERRRKDGTIFPASVTISPINDEHGALIGASSIARDVTEQQELRAMDELRRRSEEVDRANQSLEAFTYSVSHDLRAPLRAMGGYSAALLEEYGDVLGDVGQGYARRILAAGEQMAALIDDLLQLSRILRSQMRLETIDLGAEVARIAEDLQRDEPDRAVHFAIERPVEVRADHILMRTVLENLVGNAWKFTSHRDDALIEFGTTPTAGTAACCYVRDNGAGFDPAYTHQLFQPFQRLHSAGEFPGSGIGLASVRTIVERHGGRAWAEGAVGDGATFHFTLDAREIS